jgi:DNA-binding NarL/FixJ family response regulator
LELTGELTQATSLHLVARLRPDIVILDCAAPNINPLVALPQLRARSGGAQIIALCAGDTAGERALLQALGASACASLDQPGSVLEVLAAAGARGRASLPAGPAAQRTRSTPDLRQRHARHVH